LPNNTEGSTLGIDFVVKCEIWSTNGKKHEDEKEVSGPSLQRAISTRVMVGTHKRANTLFRC
jgi:hypothetical protein